MFTEKSRGYHSIVRVIRSLALMLLIAIAGLVATIFVFRTPLSPKIAMAAAVAFPPITPAVSTRCVGCISWPNSDIRLDAAHGNGADLDEVRLDGLKGIPLVLSFGVADNGNIISLTPTAPFPYKLQYNWGYQCADHHDALLTPSQIQFITSYNPTFFDGMVIDTVTQYTQFVPFLEKQILTTLIGSYHSATTCVEGLTNPFAENYYPPNVVDCYRLAPQSPASMGIHPWSPQACPSWPVRWYIDVANAGIRERFSKNLIQTVKATKPKPPFIFLDNVAYLEPEFLWKMNQKPEDCRERASAPLLACSEYTALQTQFGRGIYFEDFIEHYRTVITGLEQIGVRSILNVGAPAAVLGYGLDTNKYAKQFEEAIGQNGIAFEHPFHINPRTNAIDVSHEITLHQRLLQQDKLVVFYADYKSASASSWMAAMAMMIREPGQSLFVARDPYSSTLEWIDWPVLYGAPVTTDTVHPVIIAGRSSVGQNWFMSRQFEKDSITREITATHFGVNLQNLKTFTLTLLAPDLGMDTYSLLYGKPQLGSWSEATNVYTATQRTDPNGPVQADHFILGAQCSGTPRVCKKLIAVSAGVFK